VLRAHERRAPEEGRVLRAYTDAARVRLVELAPHAPSPIVVHGDFAPWNLRFAGGTLSGILDFDLVRLDLRVADFALAWRGRHAEVLRGYEEVSPLAPVERELIVPVYWAWLIASAVAGLAAGEASAAWAVEHLLRTRLAG
jgi:Ser/Thr protein kinase RdoA (MazF antagonist)